MKLTKLEKLAYAYKLACSYDYVPCSEDVDPTDSYVSDLTEEQLHSICDDNEGMSHNNVADYMVEMILQKKVD